MATLDDGIMAILEDDAPMTVRQVFYRAVVKGLVPKEEGHGYRVVQRRLTALREAGRLHPSWIADGTRWMHGSTRYADLDEFAAEVASLYRRDYWRHSSSRVEIWLEKDALAGVLHYVTDGFGVPLYVTRGFASISYLASAAAAAEEDGRPTHVYLLTDLDPSGLQIARQVETGLRKYAPTVTWHIHRLAVTHEQVHRWDLPTRPAKRSDTRAPAFIEAHGDISVELDATPPDHLRALVRDAIEQHIDSRELASLRTIEAAERQGIRARLEPTP